MSGSGARLPALRSAMPIAALLAVGMAALYGPTVWDLAHGAWSTDSQGHGPMVLAISLWLLWDRWPSAAPEAPSGRAVAWAYAALASGCGLYIFGRALGVLTFEVGSAVPVIAALILLCRGAPQLRAVWFALFFMCFMVPLPGALVDAFTGPMKMAVSWVTEAVLRTVGYPIARTGVILQVGPYQLLVADACAGLHTLFTLEALGLLYLNVVKSSSWRRNVGLALLIVPISFTANVIRVIVLSLVTYHLGDEAGQGFLHGFAGMVLFLSALMLIIATDSLLRVAFPVPTERKDRHV